jgi:hypothetical protein
MKIEIDGFTMTLTREPGDPKCHGTAWAKGESRLLHLLKKELNAQGYDLIKKRMWKDGHLVSCMQQYLRPRRRPKDPKFNIAVYNSRWAIEGAEKAWNEEGRTELCVLHGYWGEPVKAKEVAPCPAFA